MFQVLSFYFVDEKENCFEVLCVSTQWLPNDSPTTHHINLMDRILSVLYFSQNLLHKSHPSGEVSDNSIWDGCFVIIANTYCCKQLFRRPISRYSSVITSIGSSTIIYFAVDDLIQLAWHYCVICSVTFWHIYLTDVIFLLWSDLTLKMFLLLGTQLQLLTPVNLI